MIVMSAITAVAATALFAGFASRVVLYATLVTAAVGVVCYFALDSMLADPTTLLMLGLLVLALAVGAAIGAGMGGLYRSQAIKACMLTAFGCALLIFVSQSAGRRCRRIRPGQRRRHRHHWRDHPQLRR